MARFGKTRSQRTMRARGVRPALDAAFALAFFAFITAVAGSAPTSANPHMPGQVGHLAPATTPALAHGTDTPTVVEIATTTSPYAADAVYRRTSVSAAWVLLSFAFSVLIAFNLAVLRHMRRAYARRRPR